MKLFSLPIHYPSDLIQCRRNVKHDVWIVCFNMKRRQCTIVSIVNRLKFQLVQSVFCLFARGGSCCGVVCVRTPGSVGIPVRGSRWRWVPVCPDQKVAAEGGDCFRLFGGRFEQGTSGIKRPTSRETRRGDLMPPSYLTVACHLWAHEMRENRRAAAA